MNQETKRQILETIERLAAEQPHLNPIQAENLLMSVLQPLLTEDGYDVTHTPVPR